ncbi:MAG: response regulator [Desulfamplus sp.]|nr:response regulator [Desulfamplus sp.]MBF0242054.1 response regulator [Desulfamplus sp.]MBF0389993.1 response regulator [Desulfamplus sp.]
MPQKAFLCVDDEQTVLRSLKEQLKRKFGNKYIYEMAESPVEALEVIEELYGGGIQILIIITDWMMPGMKGDEFLIKVNERFPEIISIMITGQADDESIRYAQENANLYRCLCKPWDETELIEAIESAWENYGSYNRNVMKNNHKQSCDSYE